MAAREATAASSQAASCLLTSTTATKMSCVLSPPSVAGASSVAVLLARRRVANSSARNPVQRPGVQRGAQLPHARMSHARRRGPDSLRSSGASALRCIACNRPWLTGLAVVFSRCAASLSRNATSPLARLRAAPRSSRPSAFSASCDLGSTHSASCAHGTNRSRSRRRQDWQAPG